MLNLIEYINSSHIGLLPATTIVIMTCVAVKEIYNFIVQILGVLDIQHKNKDNEENKEDLMNELKAHNDEQDSRMSCIENSVRILQEALKENNEKSKEYTVAMCRSSMYRIYKESKKQGCTDRAAYETFEALKNIYIGYGANSITKEKIIPKFEAIPVVGIDDLEETENEQKES